MHRRALGAPLRPPFGASRLSPASVPPLGPGGAPPCDFSILAPIVKTKSRYIPREIHATQPKQRRYTYDIAVYAKYQIELKTAI